MKTMNAAIITALVSLLVVGGGTAFASHYMITSTKQIKPSVRHALEGARGPQGAQGAQGIQGPAGPVGAAGPAASVGVVTVTSPHQFLAPGSWTGGLRVNCPPG